MIYTVVWLPDAERELAELYLQLPAQAVKAFSSASNQIDAELRTQSEDFG